MSTLHTKPHSKLACDFQPRLFQPQSQNKIRVPARKKVIARSCFSFIPRCIQKIRWQNLESMYMQSGWSQTGFLIPLRIHKTFFKSSFIRRSDKRSAFYIHMPWGQWFSGIVSVIDYTHRWLGMIYIVIETVDRQVSEGMWLRWCVGPTRTGGFD